MKELKDEDLQKATGGMKIKIITEGFKQKIIDLFNKIKKKN